MSDDTGTAPNTSLQQLDPASRAWLDSLKDGGARREAAIRRLHSLLLAEARYETRRRAAGLTHPSGRDLEDLAVQAADDALVAILSKLLEFRGDAQFTTWARRFVALEVPAKIRRRLGHTREIPTEDEPWRQVAGGEDPLRSCEERELARGIGQVIAHELTPHQREVLVALTIDGTAPKELAARMHSSTGALYKTLHDARQKLRAAPLAAALVAC